MAEQQGTGKPDGNFARRALGKNVNNLLNRLHYQTESGISDNSKVAIAGGATINGLAYVADISNNDSGVFILQGGGNAVTEVSETGTAFGTGSKGTDAQINIYWDSGNSRYELENKTGGSIDVEIVILREP